MQRKGDGWEGWIGYNAPVRGEGTIDGRRWSFRARGEWWGLNIAENPGDDPEAVGLSVGGWIIEDRYGTKFDASWMTADAAWNLVLWAFEKLHQGKLKPSAPMHPVPQPLPPKARRGDSW